MLFIRRPPSSLFVVISVINKLGFNSQQLSSSLAMHLKLFHLWLRIPNFLNEEKRRTFYGLESRDFYKKLKFREVINLIIQIRSNKICGYR